MEFIKKSKIETDDFYYDLFDGGFIKLDKVLKNESCIYKIKPILTRVEDMSEEQENEFIHIQEVNQNNIEFTVKASKFFYSNHIDIHNLIDCELAIDAKTLNV